MLASFIGIAAGLLVNKVNHQAANGINPRAVRLLVKLAAVAIGVALMEQVAPRFAQEWQATTPGLFFVAYYFGMQSSLMADVHL